MKILTLASTKGGVGKSTLTGHLAADTPLFARADVRRLRHDLDALARQGITLVAIDTPPALLDTIRAAISVADVVLIPARPIPHDLRAVGVVVEMAEQAGKPFGFVVNGATPRATIALQAVQTLAQHGPVAPVILHQRIDFAGSMVDGRTVGEINLSSRSAQEITELWEYVYTQLRKYSRST